MEICDFDLKEIANNNISLRKFDYEFVREVCRNLLSTRAEFAAATAERDKANDLLQEIESWCNAYPLDIFPEPDFKVVRELLKAGGITLDCVSASNMRHVLKGVAEIAHRKNEASHD